MLASWKKSYDKPIKKQWLYFANKVYIVKAMVFAVVMYGCESWTIKKAEQWRTDAFKLWCWTRLLRVSWTARDQTSQSWGKSIMNIHWRTDAEAEAPVLWPLDAKSRLTGKDTDGGKIEGRRRRGQQKLRWLDGITASMGMQRVRHDWMTELKWTEGKYWAYQKVSK